jgi:Flp pilus assembly protein TadG
MRFWRDERGEIMDFILVTPLILVVFFALSVIFGVLVYVSVVQNMNNVYASRAASLYASHEPVRTAFVGKMQSVSSPSQLQGCTGEVCYYKEPGCSSLQQPVCAVVIAHPVMLFGVKIMAESKGVAPWQPQ